MARSKMGKNGKGSSLATWQVDELLGTDLIGPAFKMSADERERLWHRHEKELLTVWLFDARNFATRPEQWWQFCCKEKKQLFGYGSYWNNKGIFTTYPIGESVPQFLKRTGRVWPSEESEVERQCALSQETQRKQMASHVENLQVVPQAEIEAAEKRAGITFSRIVLIK